MVRDLLRGFVPGDWVRALDLNTLERCSGSYVTDDLRDRADDLIWRVRWGDEWLYVYLLLEFQSSIDPWMAVRIQTYLGLLYQDLVRAEQLSRDGRLPPVLPIVLYNGAVAWNAPETLEPLIEPAPPGLVEYRPRQRYLLLDERRLARGERLPVRNLSAALFRLEASRGSDEAFGDRAGAGRLAGRSGADRVAPSVRGLVRAGVSAQADAGAVVSTLE
ncbi:MAG: Rpn family recombination-promoting nuclease/putative transposase [Chromatiales bacterium]|nr:Rpn family recombination-promoting nuclease/putative transposase [Chromatiales bacterium]